MTLLSTLETPFARWFVFCIPDLALSLGYPIYKYLYETYLYIFGVVLRSVSDKKLDDKRFDLDYLLLQFQHPDRVRRMLGFESFSIVGVLKGCFMSREGMRRSLGIVPSCLSNEGRALSSPKFRRRSLSLIRA